MRPSPPGMYHQLCSGPRPTRVDQLRKNVGVPLPTHLEPKWLRREPIYIYIYVWERGAVAFRPQGRRWERDWVGSPGLAGDLPVRLAVRGSGAPRGGRRGGAPSRRPGKSPARPGDPTQSRSHPSLRPESHGPAFPDIYTYIYNNSPRHRRSVFLPYSFVLLGNGPKIKKLSQCASRTVRPPAGRPSSSQPGPQEPASPSGSYRT